MRKVTDSHYSGRYDVAQSKLMYAADIIQVSVPMTSNPHYPPAMTLAKTV